MAKNCICELINRLECEICSLFKRKECPKEENCGCARDDVRMKHHNQCRCRERRNPCQKECNPCDTCRDSCGREPDCNPCCDREDNCCR